MKNKRTAATVTPVINGDRDIVDDIIIKTTFFEEKMQKRVAKTTRNKQEEREVASIEQPGVVLYKTQDPYPKHSPSAMPSLQKKPSVEC